MTFKNVKICPCLKHLIVSHPRPTFRKVLVLGAHGAWCRLALPTSAAVQPHFISPNSHLDTFLTSPLASVCLQNALPIPSLFAWPSLSHPSELYLGVGCFLSHAPTAQVKILIIASISFSCMPLFPHQAVSALQASITSYFEILAPRQTGIQQALNEC